MPDIKTVMLIYVITNVISAGAVAVIWRQNRGRYAGVSFWLVGLALQAAGPLLLVLRGLIPDVISMTGSNTIVLAGITIILMGLERFIGKRGRHIQNYVLLAVFIVVSAYFVVVQPSLMARDIAVTAVIMIFTFQCGWLLLRRADPGMRQITRLTGIVFAVYAAFSFVRIIMTFIFPEQSNDFFKSGAVNALAMTGYTLLNICLTISLVLMVNRRLLADVKAQETALRESEIRFRGLFNFMSSGVAVYEAVDNGGDFIIRDFNPAAERIEKISRKDIVGKRVSEAFTGVKTFGVFEVFQRVWQTGKPEYFPTNIYKDERDPGSWRESWVFKLPTGEIVAMYNDITERKQLEEAVIESEERYRTILDQMYDVYYEVDLAGNFTFLNEATCRKLGYSQAELIGKSYRLTVPEDDIEGLFAASKAVFKSGEPNKCYFHSILHKDGSIMFAESFIGLSRNKQGEIIGFRTVSQDITERKQAEEALVQSEEKYRTILEQMHDSYFEVDLAGNFTLVNDATCRNLGYTMEELIGQNFIIIAPGEDEVKAIFEAYNKVFKTGEPYMGFTFKVIRKDGFVGYAEVSISVIKNEQGRPIGFRSVGRDHTERKQMEHKLEEMATHDALTGLPNRTLFYDRFGIAMANAQRNKKKIAIMTLDLDLFKDVNDTLGHDMGDKVLIAVAGRLTGALRKSDTIARMGGDEFVLLLWEVENKDAAVIVAEKILEDFRQPFTSDGHSLKITVSIGIAIYPENGENMEELFKCSDKMMYTAKQNGGDRFAI